MTLETYLIYLAAIAVFFATPPDTSQLLVMSNSIRHGLRRSSFTIAGDLTANSLQMLAAAFGLAAMIAASATAFTWIKWTGVAYLAWIGVRLMLSRPAKGSVSATTERRGFTLFRQGFITSMANPFAVIFFAALFPQFIDSTIPVLPQLLVLSATYLLVDGILLVAWGWLAMRTTSSIGRLSAVTLNKVCGMLMIGAAGLLAMKDFEPQRR